MANQKCVMKLVGADGSPKDLRLVLVDSDGGAATFTDYGAAASWVPDQDYTVLDVLGQGTTAPATATAFQIAVNANQLSLFLTGANIFDPKALPSARAGGLFGKKFAKASTVAITGRA